MTAAQPPGEPLSGDERPPATLSRLSFWSAYALVVSIFLFTDRQLFEDPFRIDKAIFWSYLPIPFLVVGLLAIERKLGWIAVLLDTVELTSAKFCTTYMIATVLWAASGGPPERPPPPRAPVVARARAPLPPPTPIDPASTGEIVGTVVDESGAPVGGALVYVAAGIEHLVFAPPKVPATLSRTASGPLPAKGVVQSYQPIRLVALDQRMHTALGTARDVAMVFNYPLLPGRAARTVEIEDAPGIVWVACEVHPDEPRGLLAVLPHPFWDWTDAGGRFTLSGVPAGALGVATWFDGALARTRVHLEAGAAERLTLVIGEDHDRL